MMKQQWQLSKVIRNTGVKRSLKLAYSSRLLDRAITEIKVDGENLVVSLLVFSEKLLQMTCGPQLTRPG